MIPERFGHYRFESLIGRGGMGEVFRAWDERRNRVVALKRLPRQMAQDREFRARFQRESALAAKLREPHIIPIHDYGEIDGLLYIDMRLVEGTDLAKVLKAGRITPERAVDITSQVADALDAAHAEGLIHRDVKPSNILLVGPPERAAVRGFAYLADFGIASTLGGGSTLSRPGLAVGTAAYMAPERMSGDRVDERADVYSLACMFFECLTGRRPFPASDLLQALRAHIAAPRPLPSEHGADVPPALDDVVTRGMAKDPDDRYASAGDLAEAAREALAAPDVVAEPPTEVDGLTEAGLPAVEPPPTSFPIRDRTTSATATRPTDSGRAEAPSGRPDPAPPHPSLVKSYVSPAAGGSTPPPTAADVGPTAVHPPTGGVSRTEATRSTAPVTPSQRVSPPRPRVQPEPPELPNAPTRWDGRTGPRPQAPDRPSTTTPGPRRPVDAATVAQHAVRPDPTGWTGPPPQSFPPPDMRPQQPPPVMPDAPPSPPAAAPVPSGARRRRGWVVPLLVVGALVVAAAIVVPRLLSGTPGFELVSTVAVGGGPSQVALSPDGNRAYVTNHDIGAVTVINTTTRRAVDPQVQVAAGPDAVLVAPDGRRVYVADSTANQVSVLDPATNTVAATIPVGRSPEGLAITPDGKLLYVANADDGTVTVVDTATAKPVGSPIAAGKGPRAMVISPDGKRLYVAGFDSNDVTLIDTAGATPIARAVVDDGPIGVAISPDGARLYVVNQRSSTISVIDTVAKTSDVAAARVDPSPSAVALDANGSHLYVTSKDANSIVRLDTAKLQAGKPLTVGNVPVALAVGPKDGLVYVVGQKSADVSVLRPVEP
jgi:YVTN family beta-propeller protein